MTATSRTLTSWLDYIAKLHNTPIDMTLERVLRVKQNLGLQRLDFPIVTIAGTNGKGSCCALLESMLRAGGYATGMYTSPHLLRYNERIKLNGENAHDEEICAAFSEIDVARDGISLTYFEFSTLAALLLFKHAHCQVAILEVGLGGRLDAVNAFDCDCAVITSIGIDHVSYLGNTREAIGFEKAGVFRRGKPAICADPNPPLSVIDHAAKIKAPLLQINHDFGFRTNEAGWDFWHVKSPHFGLPFPALFGRFQLYNASAALSVLSELKSSLPLTISDIRKGLIDVSWPGRFQVKPGRPMVILDVAHNPQAAEALASTLTAAPPAGKTFAVFGMLEDKDVGAVIQIMIDHVDNWFLTELGTERALPAPEMLRLLQAHSTTAKSQVFPDPLSAYQEACRLATENDRILVFGSFYTVAPILALTQGA